MAHILIAYVATAAIFFGLDLIWLSTMVDGFYRPRLAGLLLEKPNLPVAVGFYMLYVAGILIFAVLPALRAGGWTQAALMGGLFGFFAYATYDLTNLATLRGFSPAVAAVDLVWGTLATAAAAGIGTLITGWLTR